MDPPSKKKSYSHSFANEWLLTNVFTPPTIFYELYQGEKKILDYNRKGKPLFDIKPGPFGRIVDTCMTAGLDMHEKKEVQEIKEYQRLLDLGFAIVSIPFSGWFRDQKRAYKIVVYQPDMDMFERIPPDHRIGWDVYNKRLILVGKNAGPIGAGPWIEMEKHKKTILQRRRTMSDYVKNPFKVEMDYIKSMVMHTPEQFRSVPVDEIALMIDDQGQLICLPKSRDEPTIGIVGMKGKGKSLFLHRLVDMAYWKGRRKIAVLNDDRSECDTWCRPWDDNPLHKDFGLSMAKELARVGERPLPLPAVYVHAMNDNLRYITHEDECGIKISFPFDHLISNYEFYMKGKKNWELDNSLVYFKNIKDSILMCKTLDEIKEVIDRMIDPGLKNTKVRLWGLMEDIYNEKILDISNGISPFLTLKTRNSGDGKVIGETEYLQFVAMMLADLVPILESASIKNKGYFPQYFRFIANDIFRKQTEDPYFIKNKIRIWEFCDEVQNIDSNEVKTVASDILIKTVTEGRPNRTGFVWASQNPEKLSKQITTNTPYLFVLGFSNKDQAKNVAKNFDLMAGRDNEILGLQKREVIACTSEHFIVYDREGNRRKSDPKESFRGMTLPPLSQHKAPTEDEA